MVQELKSIREQLFDAPSDIKQSFNNVVDYFDNNQFCVVRDSRNGELWVIHLSYLKAFLDGYPFRSVIKTGSKEEMENYVEKHKVK